MFFGKLLGHETFSCKVFFEKSLGPSCSPYYILNVYSLIQTYQNQILVAFHHNVSCRMRIFPNKIILNILNIAK